MFNSTPSLLCSLLILDLFMQDERHLNNGLRYISLDTMFVLPFSTSSND